MKNMEHAEIMVLVYTTIQVYETTIDLAEKAVNAGHAGCVNITKHGTSVYNGKVHCLMKMNALYYLKQPKKKAQDL